MALEPIGERDNTVNIANTMGYRSLLGMTRPGSRVVRFCTPYVGDCEERGSSGDQRRFISLVPLPASWQICPGYCFSILSKFFHIFYPAKRNVQQGPVFQWSMTHRTYKIGRQ